MAVTNFQRWIFLYSIFAKVPVYLCVNPTIELLLNHSPFTGNVVNLIEGMSAELKCTSSDSSAVITWKKSGDPYFIISDEKLTIQNVQRMHSGSYTCTAAITNAQTERTVQVNVLYPPSIPTITGPYKALKDSTFNLTCHADSNPAATYKWTHDENLSSPLVQTGPVVSVENFVENDIWYHCHAQNTMVPTVGNPVQGYSTNYRQVLSQKGVYIWSLKAEYTFGIGSTLSIKCESDGLPEPSYWWTKDSDPNFMRNGARLLEENVQADFAGVYMCNAENILRPTYLPEQKTTDIKRTVIKIVDSTIPEVCRNLSCIQKGNDLQSSTCPAVGATGSCGSNSGIIAAAVIGWIVAAVAIIVAVLLFLRNRRTPKEVNKEEATKKHPTAPTASVVTDPSINTTPAKPDLPKRPVSKQKSDHIYLELHPEESRGENKPYEPIVATEEDERKADSARDGKLPYDYVEPTERKDRVVNRRTPPDGYEEPIDSENTKGQTKYDNKTNLSEGFKSGDSYLTAVKSNESTDNAIGKRQDSYEEPDDRL